MNRYLIALLGLSLYLVGCGSTSTNQTERVLQQEAVREADAPQAPGN